MSNPGSFNSGRCNSGNYNSGNYNSGRCNSGSGNSGRYNSENFNSGNFNSGRYNSGDYNSGDYNSGSFNSGFFNTDTPTVRCFNKETGIKKEDFKFPDMSGFKLTEWKNEKLVTYEYKEAWRNFWNSISDDRKQEFLNLPNFDSKIFEEITGIKIHKKQTEIENIKKQINQLLNRLGELQND